MKPINRDKDKNKFYPRAKVDGTKTDSKEIRTDSKADASKNNTQESSSNALESKSLFNVNKKEYFK